jgi:ATP-dependent Clp protease ATP-binding subunit ClpC
MTNRMARLLIALYPRHWRERYEQEFLRFLQDHPFSICAICNVIASALYQRLHSLGHPPSLFSQFTEPARRAVFFAKYEAAQLGSGNIEAEHLLLGALRENGKRLKGLLADASVTRAISADVRAQVTVQGKTATSLSLPLSPECKRILAHSQEEADRLSHRVGVEHLLLGILREESSIASEILRRHGLHLSVLRERLGSRQR